jgi:transposase
MCPGNHESVGKRFSGRTRKGSPWLCIILVEVALAAAHSKHTALSAQYHRIAARRGAKRATIALGHTILVIIYHILQDHTRYRERVNPDLTDEQRQVLQKRLMRRLEKLGYHVGGQLPSHAA